MAIHPYVEELSYFRRNPDISQVGGIYNNIGVGNQVFGFYNRRKCFQGRLFRDRKRKYNLAAIADT